LGGWGGVSGEKIQNVVLIYDSEYMVVIDCSNATESVSVWEEEKYVKICQMVTEFGEVECWPTNVLSGNRCIREFVCHIRVGFSNWRHTEGEAVK
jgi:hypothetical protein